MAQEQMYYFYTGTYASREEKALYLCKLDGDNGEMSIVNGTDGIERPSFLALHPEEHCLYAVSEDGEGKVYAYEVDEQTHELRLLNHQLTQGAHPCYVSVTKDGAFALVSNYSGGNAGMFPIVSGVGLEEMASQVKHVGSSVHAERQDGPHPHSIVPDPSGDYVMVCDLGMDQIVIYRIEEGKLVTHKEAEQPKGAGPRHLVFHPNGQFAYVANELDNTVSAFLFDAHFGELQPLQHLSTLPEDYREENTAADIRVTPCGRFLYVSNRGHNSIVLYRIDEESGKLERIEWVDTLGKTPRNFNLVGGYLIVANQESDNLVSYSIDGETGRLTASGHQLELKSPVCVEPVVR